MEAMLRSAGFQDVESRMMTLPMCGWPTSINSLRALASGNANSPRADSGHTDERERGIGTANKDNIQQLLSSMAIYPFTELLG